MATETNFQGLPLGHTRASVIVLPQQIGQRQAMSGQVAVRCADGSVDLFQDIYAAWRSQVAACCQYGYWPDGRVFGGELRDLQSLRNRLSRARVILAVARPSSAETVRLAKLIDSIAASLARKSDEGKSEARVMAQDGLVEVPSGKINVGACRARFTAIERRIALRENVIRSIVPRLKATEAALRLEINRSITVVRDADRKIGAILAAHPLFRDGQTSTSQLAVVIDQLRLTNEELKKLLAAPFLTSVRHMVDGITTAVENLRVGNTPGARTRLSRMREIAQRLLLRDRLENHLSELAQISFQRDAAKRVRLAKQLRQLAERPPVANGQASVLAAQLAKLAGPGSCVEALEAGKLDEAKNSLRQLVREITAD